MKIIKGFLLLSVMFGLSAANAQTIHGKTMHFKVRHHVMHKRYKRK